VNGLGHEARATPGGKGQFDVYVEDELVFSKQAQGRFPENDEIRGRL
jgi:selT/selW/selH-like putative selenoprotein